MTAALDGLEQATRQLQLEVAPELAGIMAAGENAQQVRTPCVMAGNFLWMCFCKQQSTVHFGPRRCSNPVHAAQVEGDCAMLPMYTALVLIKG